MSRWVNSLWFKLARDKMHTSINSKHYFTVLFMIFFITPGFCALPGDQEMDIQYKFFKIIDENPHDIHGELWVHLSWNCIQHELLHFYYVYWNGELSTWDDCCHRNIPMFKRTFRGRTRNDQMKGFEFAIEDVLSQSHTFRVEGRAKGRTLLFSDEVAYIPKLKASNPNPPDNFTALAWNTSLIWMQGDFTRKHNVYFGDNYDAVRDADNTDTYGIYRGNQIGRIYDIPDTLEFGRTYYWRIDEITQRDIVYKGDVWCFTVADYLTVDNFENYTDFSPNKIFETWTDGYNSDDYPGNGTGAIVGHREGPPHTELNIIHSGNQSMPFAYNNNKPGCLNYSEAGTTWNQPRDLISEGVQELALWFKGNPGDLSGSIASMLDISPNTNLSKESSLLANDAEQLYIGISNSNGNTSIINHPDPRATQYNDWTQWKIPLINFSTPEVTITDVNSLFIGVGNRDNPHPGGNGQLYIDDIHLYEFQFGDPTDIINTGFETNQADIDTIVSNWIGYPWALSSEAYSGDYSIQSGAIENNQNSGFQVIIDSTAGTLYNISFAIKTSTEHMFDELTFSTNSRIRARFSGGSDWKIYTFFALVEGDTLILEWVYKKDRSYSHGDDTVWLDDLLIQKL